MHLTDMVKLAGTFLSSDQQRQDEVEWRRKSSSSFNVKATYELANKWNDEEVWEGWRLMWKLKLQQGGQSIHLVAGT